MTDEMKAKREKLFSSPKNGYDLVDQAALDAMETYCESYKQYLDNGKTERECAAYTVELAQAQEEAAALRGRLTEETAAAEDLRNALAAREAEYKERFANPFVAGARGFIDDVIMPHETRKRICRSLAMLRDKQLENPWRKHGNIPL